MLGDISIDSRFSGLVKQLVEVQKRPLNTLQHKKDILQSAISEYGHLKNNLSQFSDKSNSLTFLENKIQYQANITDPSVFTVRTDSTAQKNSYQVMVNQLAKPNKISSVGFSDQTSALNATGDILISSGGQSFTLSITDPTMNLRQISDAINTNNLNTIVQASVINMSDSQGANSSVLILTALNDGVENSINLTSQDGNLLSVINLSNTIQVAQNAEFSIDGMHVVRSSNTVSDVIDGVTFNFMTTSSEKVTLSISQDTNSVKNNIVDFVNSYNSIIGELSSMPKGFNSRFMANQLSDLVHFPSDNQGSFLLLSDIGIKADLETNLLVVDDSALTGAINQKLNDVIELFSNRKEGVASQFCNLVNGYLSPVDGLVDSQINSTKKNMSDIEKSMDRIKDRVKDSEVNLTRQFAILDNIVSGFERTSEYLQQQLNGIQNSGKKK